LAASKSSHSLYALPAQPPDELPPASGAPPASSVGVVLASARASRPASLGWLASSPASLVGVALSSAAESLSPFSLPALPASGAASWPVSTVCAPASVAVRAASSSCVSGSGLHASATTANAARGVPRSHRQWGDGMEEGTWLIRTRTPPHRLRCRNGVYAA